MSLTLSASCTRLGMGTSSSSDLDERLCLMLPKLATDIDGCQYRCMPKSLPLLDPAGTAACCPPLAAEPLSQAQAEQVAPLLKALADPVRLRPKRRIRPDPAHDQPPPEGAARGGPAGPGQARRVGLLPGPRRSAGQPRRAHR